MTNKGLSDIRNNLLKLVLLYGQKGIEAYDLKELNRMRHGYAYNSLAYLEKSGYLTSELITSRVARGVKRKIFYLDRSSKALKQFISADEKRTEYLQMKSQLVHGLSSPIMINISGHESIADELHRQGEYLAEISEFEMGIDLIEKHLILSIGEHQIIDNADSTEEIKRLTELLLGGIV